MHTTGEFQFEPIKKINLSQQLVEYFIQKVEDGSFPIGEKVPNEINLAAQLNVSRNILRESMKILENYDILHTVNGKGTMVSKSAMANIQSMRFFEKLRNNSTELQLLEARMILEPQIAYCACSRCTQSDIAHLQEIVAASNDSPPSASNFDEYNFHIALSKICGNDILTEFLHTILFHLREGDYAQFNGHTETGLCKESEKDHRALVEAFMQHDPAAARQIMEKHLRDRICLIHSSYRLGAPEHPAEPGPEG